ncbi:MAG: hypothetical protein CMK07_16405 [Ponticaulis sp.]|nr:hypothetical protein [Ponticaulis sp.]
MSSSRVRLLPVIGIVAFGVLSVKAVSIAEAAGAMAAENSEPSASPTQPIETSALPEMVSEQEESSETESGAEENMCPSTDQIAEQAGLSQYEIQVLRSLADRRESLDARESTLDTREMTISAAETRLNDQIDELKRLEASIQGLLVDLDEQNEEQLASLVKVYESMKPKDAARIFDTLDDILMLELADRMKPAAMAAVLSNMNSERARALTTLMAKKTEPPETVSDLEARSFEP